MKILITFLLPIFFLFVFRIHGHSSRTNENGKLKPGKEYKVREDEFDHDDENDDLFMGGRFPRDVTAESDEEADYEEEEKMRNEQQKKRRQLDNTKLDQDMSQVNSDPVKSSTASNPNDITLPEGYSIYEIPMDRDGSPMPLYINFNIKKILDFDELNEMIKLDIEFKVMWTDFKILYFNTKSNVSSSKKTPPIDDLSPAEIRLKRKVLNNPYILEKIWKPNLFIENLLAVRQPAIMARPLTIQFIPEVGWFEYITRISVKLDCSMDFNFYPADTQRCDFTIRGFSYTKEKLNLNWYKHGVFLEDTTLPSFDVIVKSTSRYYWHKMNEPDEEFDVLAFRVLARRKLSYHLVQTYLASTFYIIITCLCFLLPSKMVEARIGISMTTLLTLTVMFASVRESTPIVSYVKAIDVWMVGSIFFVFLTLSQFTFHIWLRNVKDDYIEKEKARHKQREGKRTYVDANGRSIESLHIEERDRKYAEDAGQRALTKFKYHDILAILIDKYSFPLFISIFAIYTIIYWTWLLKSADYFN